jgi:hypothetical protein
LGAAAQTYRAAAQPLSGPVVIRSSVSHAYRLHYIKKAIASNIEKGVETTKQEKAVETTKQEKERRKERKPKDQEGVPHHKHCPLAKRCEDSNPKYHEEQQKDVA